MQPVVSISKCKASAEQWKNMGKVFKLIRFEDRAVLALEGEVAVVPKIPLSWESASSSSSGVCTTLVVADSAQVADSVAFEWKPVDLSCLESSGEEEERDQEEEEDDDTFQLEGDEEEEEEEKPFGEAAKAFAIAETPFVWKAPAMELATPPSGEAAKAFAIEDDVDDVP